MPNGVAVEENGYADLTKQGVSDIINVRGIRAQYDDPWSKSLPDEPVINHAEDYCYRHRVNPVLKNHYNNELSLQQNKLIKKKKIY